MTATVDVDVEMIELSPSMYPEPDPDWEHVDSNGHRHYRADDAPHYPTLEEVEDETYWCVDCHEEHTQSHLACVACGEEIKPGTRPPSPFGTTIRGMQTLSFTVPTFIDSRERVTVETQGRVYKAEAMAHESVGGGLTYTTLVAVEAPTSR